MRVIAGISKGRKLKVPHGPDIRPVTDTIKEAFFNSVGPYLEGKTFLDLFAGSGSMGIEALSRMAEAAVFVEKNPQAVAVIWENLRLCQLESRARVIRGDVFRVTEKMSRNGERFDLVYVDPPFRQTTFFTQILNRLANLMNPGGLAVVRSLRSLSMTAGTPELVRVRVSTYGDSALHYYRLAAETVPD